jgi:RNA polymerase-binding transcription factor DksA
MTLQEKIQLQLSGIPNFFNTVPPYYKRDIETAVIQAFKDYLTEKGNQYDQKYEETNNEHYIGAKFSIRELLQELAKTSNCDKCSAPIPEGKETKYANFTLCPACAQHLGSKCQKGVTYNTYITSSGQCGVCKGPCSWSK